MSPREETHVFHLGGKYLYLLSHLDNPKKKPKTVTTRVMPKLLIPKRKLHGTGFWRLLRHLYRYLNYGSWMNDYWMIWNQLGLKSSSSLLSKLEHETKWNKNKTQNKTQSSKKHDIGVSKCRRNPRRNTSTLILLRLRLSYTNISKSEFYLLGAPATVIPKRLCPNWRTHLE